MRRKIEEFAYFYYHRDFEKLTFSTSRQSLTFHEKFQRLNTYVVVCLDVIYTLFNTETFLYMQIYFKIQQNNRISYINI